MTEAKEYSCKNQTDGERKKGKEVNRSEGKARGGREKRGEDHKPELTIYFPVLLDKLGNTFS